MHLNIIFLLHTISAAVLALLFLLLPTHTAGLLGVPSSDMTPGFVDFARFFGVCMTSIALVTYLAQINPSKYARGMIVKTMLLLQLVAFVASFTLHYPPGNLLAIVACGLFALLYIYVLLFRQQDIEGPFPPP